ncbi:hypothetical protein LOD99_369 [Oopsacas minuta]|uniref:Uncharacterized protein n=1 Tax=Oopsacas minuta TaxID=111878 RepID=A0AAV7KBE9_9METZ|nr:hypothetical protein LOD99_369 [Oopsacas minuta]
MPRYLSKNYFKEHAIEIEELLDRCLLVSPGAHFTENCQLSATHEELYKPWEVSNYKHLFENSSLLEDRSIEEELRALSTAVPQVESIWDCDKDQWEEFYEIDMNETGSYSLYEVFYPDNTYLYNEWISGLNEDNYVTVSNFFEDMESCNFLSLEPDKYYPSVDKLVGRWKSKPVTDPLLGDNGEPLLTEEVFLREDRVLDIELGACDVNEEQFCRELIGDDEVVTINGIMSLFEEPKVPPIENYGVEYIEEALQFSSDVSPLSIVTYDKLIEDMSLLNACKVSQLITQVENQLDISFTEEVAECSIEVPIEQHQDTAWTLESPLIDPQEPSLLSQLTNENTLLPLTPFTTHQFLSPTAIRKYELALRTCNQMPDEISNLMLVEPSISVNTFYPAVQYVIEQLEMKLDGNVSALDMELRWDPLTHFYDQIELVKQRLFTQCSLEIKGFSAEMCAVSLFILKENQIEDLTRYDTLLPGLDRESLASSYYSQNKPAMRLHSIDDDIFVKQKVQLHDHTARSEIRLGIHENSNSQNYSLPLARDNSKQQISDTFNHIDSIDSFLLLRQKRQSPQSSTTVSPEHTQHNHTQPKRICLMTSPKQATKLSVLDVPLNRLYREAINLLTAAGEPLLRQVQEYGYLQDSSYTSLVKSPDILQFLLREHKHQWLENDMPMGNTVWYKLRVISQLFCLVSCGYALVGTSLSAAIDVLFGSVNKYKVLVQNSLVTTGNSLIGMQESVHSSSFHPKIIQTISILLEKEKTLTKCFSVCIIVFDIACTFNLAGEMFEILKSQVGNLCINLIKAPSNETYNNYHELLKRAFDASHCLLCESSTLNYDNFPWERISLIILYNLKDTSKSVSLVNEKTHEDCRILVLRTSMESDLINLQKQIPDNPQKSSFIICSTEVCEEQGLLEIIESKCNLLVVERDYVGMGLDRYSADIIVNENTGILLVNLASLHQEGGLHKLTDKLQNVKLAYNTCYVLAFTKSTEEYMKGDGPKMLAALNYTISKLQYDNFKIELKGSTEIQGIADIIRTIVSNHSTSKCEDTEIEIEASEQEKWLLSLRCVNACAALNLLSKYTLTELIRVDLSELSHKHPRIPTQCLESLHQICSQNYDQWKNVGDRMYQENNDCNSNNTNNNLLNSSPNHYATSKLGSTDNAPNFVHSTNDMIVRTNINQLLSDPVQQEDYYNTKPNKPYSTGSIIRNTWVKVGDYRPQNNNNNRINKPIQTGRNNLSEGLLEFQKQQTDTRVTIPIETTYTNTSEYIQWLDETMDTNHRELSCKQVPGVSQTKLIFKEN